jgi:hypothetical protein
MGGERAARMIGALAAAQQPPFTERLDRRIFDYVQIVDELLGPDDPYWSLPDDPGMCWGGVPPGRQRFDVCNEVFGSAAEGRGTRDLPILEASETSLVVSRFFAPAGASREVVYKDPSNATQLQLARCCFHHQVTFKVRASAQWVAIGTGRDGFLHHVTRGPGGRCAQSCDPRLQLLNARAPSLPSLSTIIPHRDSPLAMRNPAFSFFMRTAGAPPQRDMVWSFRTGGSFQPLVISLAGTSVAINPQSMRFIESLGQIAVVDAASQGLVLIHLGGVTVARAPYF